LDRVGKKILLTGNGRCNCGNADKSPKYWHGSIQNAQDIVSDFDVQTYFRELGVILTQDSAGRFYPHANTAASILDAFRLRAEALGVHILCNHKVVGLSEQGGWHIACENGARFHFDGVIVAVGGSVAQNCGTDGNFLPILQSLGLKIKQPHPVLCPILTDRKRVVACKGLRVRAQVTAILDGESVGQSLGEVQFLEDALSGICVYQLARYFTNRDIQGEISLNLLPELEQNQVRSLFYEILSTRQSVPAEDAFTGLFPKRIAQQVLKTALPEISFHQPFTVDDQHIEKIARTVQDWRFPVRGLDGKKAQVTQGGVRGKSVDRNLCAVGYENLAFCGEVLDIDGDCGGYNLMWAFATGARVGREMGAM